MAPMIRHWFRALARKTLSLRPLQTQARATRRLGVALRLEELEDRTITSTLQINSTLPPSLLQGIESSFLSANGYTSLSQPSGPALDRLLSDIQVWSTLDYLSANVAMATDAIVTPQTQTLSNASAFAQAGWFAIGNGDITPASGPTARFQVPRAAEVLVSPQNLPDSTGSSGSGASPPQTPPASNGRSQITGQAGEVFPATGLSNGIVEFEEEILRDGADPVVVSFSVSVTAASPPTPEGLVVEVIASPGSDSIAVSFAGAELPAVLPAFSSDPSKALGSPAERLTRLPSPANVNQTAFVRPTGLPFTPAVVSGQPGIEPPTLVGPAAAGMVAGSQQSNTATVRAARPELQPLPTELPDSALLQRFVAQGEQAAFKTLVQRYERFVLNVCERILGDAHAAQDALQTTFLVLARKANLLDSQSPLANWLYRVAYHVALRLRALAARQRRYEKNVAVPGASQDASGSASGIEKEELRQALREELQLLPEKQRTPLLLCYFDGLSHEEAARTMGVPRGSMAKRIREGLDCLRERLCVRGLLP
jgi:RNA polymerase sigma factor (sigma-70 family)